MKHHKKAAMKLPSLTRMKHLSQTRTKHLNPTRMKHRALPKHQVTNRRETD